MRITRPKGMKELTIATPEWEARKCVLIITSNEYGVGPGKIVGVVSGTRGSGHFPNLASTRECPMRIDVQSDKTYDLLYEG